MLLTLCRHFSLSPFLSISPVSRAGSETRPPRSLAPSSSPLFVPEVTKLVELVSSVVLLVEHELAEEREELDDPVVDPQEGL